MESVGRLANMDVRHIGEFGKYAARLHRLECGDFDVECRLQKFPRAKLIVRIDCLSFNVGVKVSL